MTYRPPDPLLPTLQAWLEALVRDLPSRPEAALACWKPEASLPDRDEGPGWRLECDPLNGRSDWLVVRTTRSSTVCVWLIASGGHVAIHEVAPGALSRELTRRFEELDGWEQFLAEGPGPGH